MRVFPRPLQRFDNFQARPVCQPQINDGECRLRPFQMIARLRDRTERGHIEATLPQRPRQTRAEGSVVIKDHKRAIFERRYPWVRLNRFFHPSFSAELSMTAI